MKYCPSCGKQLPSPNPKHCPSCGTAIRAAPAVRAAAPAVRAFPARSAEMPKLTWMGLLKIFGFVVIGIIFLMAVGTYAGAPWQRADAAGTQYYAQMTLFENDLADQQSLSSQYGELKFSDATFARKSAFAGTYALKAGQAETTWDYFYSFLVQNEGSLAMWGINATITRTQITDSKTIVRNTAGRMASELEAASAGNATRTTYVSGAVEALKALSRN
ncbi:Uncharacterised protein [Candidatus Norongarragalina meridionalis]|nr:Uncharacterised protein [Candidatus Norongarragalina meridionalis]